MIYMELFNDIDSTRFVLRHTSKELESELDKLVQLYDDYNSYKEQLWEQKQELFRAKIQWEVENKKLKNCEHCKYYCTVEHENDAKIEPYCGFNLQTYRKIKKINFTDVCENFEVSEDILKWT